MCHNKQHPINQEDMDQLAKEIEQYRKELDSLVQNLNLVHTGVVKISQELDEKIVSFMKLQNRLKNQRES